jgi:hypothetical protein
LIGSPNILTDGLYAWPEDLAYYVEHYNVCLPEEFQQTAIRNNWEVPSNIDIDDLDLAFED